MDAADIEAQLRALEPLFHGAGPSASREVFEGMTAAGFWEVGASGNVYEREVVLAVLESRDEDPAEGLWRIRDFRVRRLADGVWLATYELDQVGRLTRRSTVWRRDETGWCAEYHQGTLVQATGSEPGSPSRPVT